MKREIAEKWIADLRTNPPQAKRKLFDGDGHCCLGRLCIVLGATFERDPNGAYYPVLNGETYYDYATLHADIMEMAGMNSGTGTFVSGIDEYGDTETDELADVNDNGASFAALADIIETKWESL